MTCDSKRRARVFLQRALLVALAIVAGAGCRSRISTAEKDMMDREEIARRNVGERMTKPVPDVVRDVGCGGRRAIYAQFDSGEVIPVRPTPGSEINQRLVYSVCPATTEQLTGTLTRRLYFGRTVIMEDRERVVLRPGQWTRDIFLKIPPAAEIGWYRLEAVFENGVIYARDRRDFQLIAPPKPPAAK